MYKLMIRDIFNNLYTLGFNLYIGLVYVLDSSMNMGPKWSISLVNTKMVVISFEMSLSEKAMCLLVKYRSIKADVFFQVHHCTGKQSHHEGIFSLLTYVWSD